VIGYEKNSGSGKKMEKTSHPILPHEGLTLFPLLFQFIPRTVDFFLSANGSPQAPILLGQVREICLISVPYGFSKAWHRNCFLP
jgi:hypothetical protein